MRSMVEGHRRVLLPSQSRDPPTCPSTTFGGPPPRAGEEFLNPVTNGARNAAKRRHRLALRLALLLRVSPE